MLILKIAAGIILALVLLAVGCSALVASSSDDVSEALADVEREVEQEIAEEESERASRVLWEWVDDPKCAGGPDWCWQMTVEALEACPSGLYVELNLLNEAGTVVGYTNDALGRLDAGRSALLTFESYEKGTVKAEVAEVSCY